MTHQSPITTHVLDTVSGRPAAELEVTLDISGEAGEWNRLAQGRTDQDGRVSDLESGPLRAGAYRLTFHSGDYFRRWGQEFFHPLIQIVFRVDDLDRHYHVPVLLSPFGYTTYRGS